MNTFITINNQGIIQKGCSIGNTRLKMILIGIETQKSSKGFCSWNMDILPSYDLYEFYYSAKGWLFKFFALGRWKKKDRFLGNQPLTCKQTNGRFTWCSSLH